MVTRTDRPLLENLDPETFATEMVGAMAAMLNRLHNDLARPPLCSVVPVATPLYQLALHLARFALDGTPLDDPDLVIREMHARLHRSLLAPTPKFFPEREDPQDLDLTPGGWGELVLLAAQARLALLRKKPVPTGELAALANTSADYVRQKIREGVLHAVKLDRGHANTAVKHADALAWAKSRGVRGLEKNNTRSLLEES